MANCKVVSGDDKKQTDNTHTAQPDDDPTQEWYCPHCGIYHPLQVKWCTKCKRKKDVVEAEEVKPVKAQAEVVNAWANLKPEDGDMEMAPVDQETANKKKKLEEGIQSMKAISGQEAVVKDLEEQLKNLQKKKLVRIVEKDCMSVA